MLVVNMSMMPLKVIGKEACLWARGCGLVCGLLKKQEITI
jgi:hypothetical protein